MLAEDIGYDRLTRILCKFFVTPNGTLFQIADLLHCEEKFLAVSKSAVGLVLVFFDGKIVYLIGIVGTENKQAFLASVCRKTCAAGPGFNIKGRGFQDIFYCRNSTLRYHLNNLSFLR
jgi:hypothetical protein